MRNKKHLKQDQHFKEINQDYANKFNTWMGETNHQSGTRRYNQNLFCEGHSQKESLKKKFSNGSPLNENAEIYIQGALRQLHQDCTQAQSVVRYTKCGNNHKCGTYSRNHQDIPYYHLEKTLSSAFALLDYLHNNR